jgi:hypothetical protein
MEILARKRDGEGRASGEVNKPKDGVHTPNRRHPLSR